MKKKTLPENIINPFSDSFLDTWDLWRQYRWEEHKFKYKGVLSEQAALMQLNDVSNKNEEKAIAIIKQSMANGWKGFFELKINGNGQSNSKNNEFTREGVSQELGSRNYERYNGK
jgi:hypothetical protein